MQVMVACWTTKTAQVLCSLHADLNFLAGTVG